MMWRLAARASRTIGLFLAMACVVTAAASAVAQEPGRTQQPSSHRPARPGRHRALKRKHAVSKVGSRRPSQPPLPRPGSRPPRGSWSICSIRCRETQGSWVNMTVDPKGRLIVSDQYGKLYRVIAAAGRRQGGGRSASSRSTRRSARPTACSGPSTASTWSSTAAGGMTAGSIASATPTTTTGSTRSSCLRKLDGGGEHGPHAVILAPDGKSLYVVAGNATRLTETRRLAGAAGLGRGQPAAPHGRRQRLHDRARRPPAATSTASAPTASTGSSSSIGYRNPFDIAFNRDGELFTYDSDMEWDVQHALVPAHARAARHQRRRLRLSQRLRQVAALLHRQPAAGGQRRARLAHRRRPSATGPSSRRSTRRPFTSATGATASSTRCTSQPKGSTYAGELEEFLAGTPLALTDVVVNPKDGAMYFAVGGRNTQSGLYRVTYAGDRADGPRPAERPTATLSRPAACGTSSKRSTATRTRRPSRPPGRTWATPTASSAGPPGWRSSFRTRRSWREKALAETSSPEAALNALLALTHVSAQDPAHRRPDAPPPDPALRDQILAALDRIAWDQLGLAQQLDLLRVYQVVLNRFGRPDDADRRSG